jgi:very-short-patch-repair endonuclease
MPAPRPVDVLRASRGTATTSDLVGLCGRYAVERAVSAGTIERVRRGHYALPALEPVMLVGQRLNAVVSHESAALMWGLDLAARPTSHHLTIGRWRVSLGPSVVTHWADLRADEVDHGVTSPVRTVLDCSRSLSIREALVVADSALRKGTVTVDDLSAAATALRGAGAARVRRLVALADSTSGSALESLLRGLLVESGVTTFVPQLVIRDGAFFARVDLADPVARLVLEADSFTHHGYREAFARDCRRYDELVVRGWTVLRFAWEHVMFDPSWVLSTVRAARAQQAAGWAHVGRSV